MSRIVVAMLLSLVVTSARAQDGGAYRIAAYALGSGGRAQSAEYLLHGILGPPGVPGLTGGAYRLHGGFDFGGESPPPTTSDDRPTRVALRGPSPNPSSGRTSFRLDLPESGPVRAEIYSSSGRRVRLLVDRTFAAGRHDLQWNARDDAGRAVSAGVYFMRVATAERLLARRLVLLAP